MLGVGTVPALAYFLLLFIVPQSPRWLMLHNRHDDARRVLNKIGGDEYADYTLKEIEENIEKDRNRPKAYFRQLLSKEMRLIMIIGLGIAALQQISAINAILYYSSLIFQTAGGAKDTALMQAVIIGVVNLVFTVVAMYFIDKLGRKPLLIIGLTGIIIAYLISAAAFYNATYTVTPEKLDNIVLALQNNKMDAAAVAEVRAGLSTMVDTEYGKEIAFFDAVKVNVGTEYSAVKDVVLQNSIHMNAFLVLIGILLFIGSFAISLGPVTWALLSEIFPNRVRGLAISIAGTFNALVSTIVITIFPIELATIGTGTSFLIFGILCAGGLLFVLRYIPETKGKSLEEIQHFTDINGINYSLIFKPTGTDSSVFGPGIIQLLNTALPHFTAQPVHQLLHLKSANGGCLTNVGYAGDGFSEYGILQLSKFRCRADQCIFQLRISLQQIVYFCFRCNDQFFHAQFFFSV